MFRIIAIEIIQPPSNAVCMMTEEQLAGVDLLERAPIDLERSRYQTVHKGLVAERPYIFYEGYTIENGKVDGKSKLADNFFAEGISVCGIVGENGSGKSTLIELILRMMNNAGYVLRNAFKSTDPYDEDYVLHFIPTIYARMYVETDDGFYTITQENKRFSFAKQNSEDGNWDFTFEDLMQEPIKNKEGSIDGLSQLFYTIMVNYAAYAYNIYDYSPEWTRPIEKVQPKTQEEDNIIGYHEFIDDEHRCWIGSLFHKNDGYQAPVVLNPYRSRGNINFNNENTLLRDRLFFLIRSVEIKTLGNILQGKIPQTFVVDENGEYNQQAGKDFYSLRVCDQMERGHYLKVGDEEENSRRTAIKGGLIIEAWGDALGGIDLMNQNRRDNSDYLRALNYVVYKTLKITHTYDDYYKYKFRLDSPEVIKALVAELCKKKNHITRKLRRALAYLVYQHIGTSFREDNLGKEVEIAYFLKCAVEYSGRKNGLIEWYIDDLMPAPCFNTDIRFLLPDDRTLPMSQFSSGEKQMLHLVCTIIYHLININGNAAEPQGKVGYKYVNLMIDEIELYFHPRYQTLLLNFLLGAIRELRLEGIKGINLIISTHSPYLLSDIPKSNVLRLHQGKVQPQEEQKENFAANVYDILHSQFFMDRFMGDFAFDKVVGLVKKVEQSQELGQEERNSIREELHVIGDNFVRNTLLQKLDKYDQD